MLEDRDYMRSQPSDGRFEISATVVLVVLNVAVFVGMLALGVAQPEFLARLGDWLALSPEGLTHGFVWQLLTFQFLHAGLVHLVCNMVGLVMFGRLLERYLGKSRFVALYLVCGTVGGLCQVALGFAWPAMFGGPVVGASAGVFGLIAALSRLMPDLEVLLFFLIPMKARWFILLAVIVSVACMFTPSAIGIAHAAHLGGIATGAAWIALGWHHDYIALPWERFFSRCRNWRPLESRQRKRELVRAASVRSEAWKRRPTDAIADLPPDEFISKEVDPILEKISAHGIQSLTEREKKILEAARKKMAKR